MKNYNKFLNIIKENKTLYEFSINPNKLDKIDRLKDAKDFKNILNIYNDDIKQIKDIIKNINYDEIFINKQDDEYVVEYNSTLYTILKAFEVKLFKIKEYPDILNKIFGDGYEDLFLEISIEENNLNRIDILNGLPNFMKNLGLGKKIYKTLIEKFNYISSFYGYQPSIDSDMTWLSVLKDTEIYSFINDNNIISFWNEYSFDNIIEKLKIFFNQKNNVIFDDDFLTKYNLTEKELKKLI